MSRRKVMRDIREEAEEVIEDAEVVMRWSRKRIVIATLLVVIIIVGGMYALALIDQSRPKVLGSTSDKPQIKLPSEKNLESIIEKAKEDLGNINPENVIESQPKIQRIIDDLSNIANASSSAKNLICNAVCR